MVINVVVQDHTDAPDSVWVETDKLNPSNPVDKSILDAFAAGEDGAYIDASGWDDDSPFGGNEPHITNEAVVESSYKTIHVTIDYQC